MPTSDAHVDDKVDGGGQGTERASRRLTRQRRRAGKRRTAKGMRHGEDYAGVKHNGIEANPIDTRITVFSKPRLGHALAAHDWKKMKAARRPGISDDHHRKLTHTIRGQSCTKRDRTTAPANKSQWPGRRQKRVLMRQLPRVARRRLDRCRTAGPAPASQRLRHYGFVLNPAHDGRLRSPPLSPTLNHSIINGIGNGPPELALRHRWRADEESRGRNKRHGFPTAPPVKNQTLCHGLMRPLATALIAASVLVPARSLIRALSR